MQIYTNKKTFKSYLARLDNSIPTSSTIVVLNKFRCNTSTELNRKEELMEEYLVLYSPCQKAFHIETASKDKYSILDLGIHISNGYYLLGITPTYESSEKICDNFEWLRH